MRHHRKINFNAGPAALPEEVLKEASEAVIDYKDGGLSILEIQHRSKAFDNIIEEATGLVRELSEVGNDYEVLWLHGGGRLQFCMIPMNFLGEQETAGYIDSGHWSDEAMQYARYYGAVNMLSSTKDSNYDHLPEWPTEVPKDLSYLHFTTNNTIYGTQWPVIPSSNVPLIADMSSDIFSRKAAFANCAMFYAAAQKNIGPAGVAVAVIHKDLLKKKKRDLPPMLDYNAQVAQHSVLNTSPVFAIYTSMLTLRWTRKKGLDVLEQENKEKAKLLYEEIDRNSVFSGVVKNAADRSMMNVCFRAADDVTEQRFINYCNEHNIDGVKGHRSVGGFRASIYNAVSVSDVKKLVAAMAEFEKTNKE
jgi:phosphoserine aminotransferase